MLESLVVSILNRFLKNYVSNLNYDQLKIGIWKGEVNLRNLKLRKDALDKLNLPINVSEGYLGEITLVIPWSNLGSEPVKVIIDHVYLLAEPKNEASVTVEEEEERAQQLKRRRLENMDLLDSTQSQEEQKDKDNDGFLGQFTTKIIDNVQFTMKNIHIRYEDKLSDAGHTFACGITLKELSALSTDENWSPKFISESSGSINKLAALESLSIYWNTEATSLAGMRNEVAAQVFTDLIPTPNVLLKEHQYILKPVSGTGKIKLNKSYGGNIPKTDVTLLFDEIAFGLDDHQYRDAILMIDLFHANLKKQKYLKFHPEKGKTAKSHPREYFQFAGKAILSEIHERNYKWSWDSFRTRRDQRRKYIECYVAGKLAKATPEQNETIAKLERELTFEDIRFYRSIAKSQLRLEKVRIDKEKEKKKAENESRGWLSWIRGTPSTNPAENGPTDSDTDSIHVTDEQMKELYHAIDYDEDKAEIASAVDIPKDSINFSLKTKLNRGSFTLKQNVKKKDEAELVSIVFEAVSVDVTQYVESMKVEAALGDLQLFDGTTKDTIYPQLIGVKKKENDKTISLLDIQRHSKIKSGNSINLDYQKAEDPFFSVVFEKNPLDKRANNALSLKMRLLEIIYSAAVIEGIAQFFKPPSSKMESVNALIAVAGDTFNGLKLQTRAGLEFALETHTTLDLDVDMDAPIIIIPESLKNQDSSVIIIDAGHISVDSQFADKNVIDELKNKNAPKHDNNDTEALKSLMYDKFNLQLTQTKVLIGKSTKDCLWQLQNNAPLNGVDDRFIERIDMDFLVELCILPGKTEFAKMKVSGHLPLLSVNLSDDKYKILMKIIDIAIPKLDDEIEIEIAEPKKRPQMTAKDRSNTSNLLTDHFWAGQSSDLLLYDSSNGKEYSSTSLITNKDFVPRFNSIDTFESEQFKLNFKVDKVSAVIFESGNLENKEDTLLCELVLENFQLKVTTRPNDLLVDFSLKSLGVIDKIGPHHFQYLITSQIIESNENYGRVNDKDLVHVKYRKAARNHPKFKALYDEYDQTVDVALSTLTVIVNRKSLLRIYNWIMNTFTSPSNKPVEISHELENSSGNSSRDDYLDIDEEIPHHDIEQSPVVVIKNSENDTRMKVAIKMDSISLILNQEGLRLGTIKLSVGEIIVLLEPKTIQVNGRFGDFTLSDDVDVSDEDLHNTDSSVSEKFIISIVGDELADFTYRTYDPNSNDFPNYNQMFKLRMGAIHLLLTDSVKPTLNFLQEFLEMKGVYDAARDAALETAQQYQESTNRFHFDIIVKSPVLIVPVGENKESNSLIAHLGEIRANNSFVTIDRRNKDDILQPVSVPVTRINCGLYDINLYSVTKLIDKSNQITELSLPIIDDVDITFDINNPEDPKDSNGPSSQIEGNISDIRMSLTENQYQFLLDAWNIIQKNFLASEDTDTNSIESDSNRENPSSDNLSNNFTNSQVSLVSSAPRESRNIIENQSKINLDLFIKLHLVCLEIVHGEVVSEDDKKNNSLSKLTFDGIILKLQNMSDASMLMEVAIQSINFADTRVQSKSKFREILPANTLDGPQFQFRLWSYNDEDTPVMDIKMTVDSPKIILSLDYLFLLKDFFMKPFVVIEPTEAQKYANAYGENERKKTSGAKQQLANQPPTTTMKIKIIVADLNVICLARPENEASEAVMLSFNELVINQNKALEVNLNKIGMVLCRMDNIVESTVHFVEDFNVVLKMETASTKSVHNLTSIKLHLDPIIFRLSYQDAMLITTIANKAMALVGGDDANVPPKPDAFDTGSETGSIDTQVIDSDDGDSHLLNINGPVTVLNVEKPKSIEPFIIMSKESLVATFEGIQVVLIEDLHDLPFLDIHIDPFVVNVSDWSRSIQADVDFFLKMSYFNFKNSHWEPIIEPWGLSVKLSQDTADKSNAITVQSSSFLYINVSHTLIESILAISGTLSQTKLLSQTAQTQVKPYLIRNYTGYDIRFWNMCDDAGKGDRTIVKLESGKTLPWTFRDWKKRRERVNLGKNLFGVQIDQCNWESLSHIPVDKESQYTYRLKPDYNGVFHRLVVDIHLENNIKTVTFRSGLMVENKSSVQMQIAIVNHDRKILSELVTLKPYEIYNVPILLVYNNWIVVRPSEKFEWSLQKLNWADMLLPTAPKCVECLPLKENAQTTMKHNYQLAVEFDKRNPKIKEYPSMKIQFCPPVEIENLLPFGFDLTLTDQEAGNKIHSFVDKGNTSHFHNMMSSSSLVIQLDLKSDRYRCSDMAVILPTENYSASGAKILITDQNEVPLTLKMNINRMTSSSGALLISIFSPYLIINKTGLPISLRHKQSYRQGRIPIEKIPAYTEGEVMEPVIFSYPESSHHNRAQISINESKWSDPISFEAVGNTQEVTLSSKTDNYVRHAGIRVEEGVGNLRLTKIVTITPRFIIKNNMNVKLKFCEFGDTEATSLDPGQKSPLRQTNRSNVKWLCLQLQELDNFWSAPFDIQEVGKTFVKVDKGDGSIPYLVRVSVSLRESTVFVTFNEDDDWPYYIVNKSSVSIKFRQTNAKLDDYDLKDKQKKALKEPRVFTLPPGERLKYTWDIPIGKEKGLELLVEERRRVINFEAIGAQVPFRYKKHRDGPVNNYTLSIDVMADDSALVLYLTDFDLEKSLYRPKSSGTSTLASSSREGSLKEAFETVNVQYITNYTFSLKMSGIGISLINKKAQEVLFTTIKGLDFKYTDSNMYQSIRFSIQWLQIDNQLYGSTYPILCYPTTLPKISSELVTHPTLHIALDKVKDDRHGVLYFKLFSILLQEMTFEMDEDLLMELIDFAQLEGSSTNTNLNSDMYVMSVEEPVADVAQALYYFEEFYIQPMRLNISFVKTDKMNDAPTDADRSSAMGYIFNVFTMTLGNINDAPIKLNALMVENLRASSEDLTARIMLHYREQIIYQIHRVLGSIDILGNPVGLFSTLSSGFGELFYEPYQGFIMSDRPQDLGIGIAKGVGGFVKKGVFGITDSMSRFTGSLGKGISAATMDKKFQDRRRMNMTRNKPTHALYGVTQGVGYFGTSIASGVVGLVKRPMEGAENNGISGFVEGIGRGVVGVFTKPVVGFLDMASNITAGIRETTTVFDGNALTRERIPRYTGKDGIIIPYSQREALGQMWLKEVESGKYFNEIYIAHNMLNNENTVAILTYSKILIVRTDNLKLETCILLENVESAVSDDNGVHIMMKKDLTYDLNIAEKTSRDWFAEFIESTINQVKEELERS